jgi:LAO/AO transport system kinase
MGRAMAKVTESPVAPLVQRALEGERLAIAKLISIVEDGAPELAEVMAAVFPRTGNALTIGITGTPGAGKSTLTEGLIGEIRKGSHSVAVLAVDPSSPFTGGALLGDRVRMQTHTADREVFIRSMATRGHLGGLSLATPEAVRILDAVGHDFVIIETVGVGQDEVDIVETADTTVVVVNPGWGDSVQVGKAGLLEIGDVFAVNKADREGVKQTVRDLNQMIDFGQHAEWRPPIIETVATDGKGLQALWAAITSHQRHLRESGDLEHRRRRLIGKEISNIVAERVRTRIRRDSATALEELVDRVIGREMDPYAAAEVLVGKLGIE